MFFDNVQVGTLVKGKHIEWIGVIIEVKERTCHSISLIHTWCNCYCQQATMVARL